MATLQEALDRIGYQGSPSVSSEDLDILCYKFSQKCPMSTIHIDGTLRSAVEAEFVDRIITQGIGGVCIELAVVFKWLLDQIGFQSKLVEIQSEQGAWDERAGVIVEVDNEQWFCAFGFAKLKLCKPVLVETGYERAQVSVEYNSGAYSITNTENHSVIKFKEAEKQISHWNTTCESYSISGRVVDKDVINISIDECSSRMYYNDRIIEYNKKSTNIEDYDNRDLVELFNYHGTI